MIAVVGSRDLRIGFGLAGVKKAYKDMARIDGEKIVIVEDIKIKTGNEYIPKSEGVIVVKVSVTEDTSEIPEKFIKQVIGANVVVK